MKVGDLVWYNVGGSKEIALVLDHAKIQTVESGMVRDMMLIQWAGDSGGLRPRMYKKSGQQAWSVDGAPRNRMGWVPIRSTGGFKMFKVISEENR